MRIFLSLILIAPLFTVKAQTALAGEVNRMVAQLVDQINQFDEISTVAVDDFTDLTYRPNTFGKRLSEEFLTSFALASGKKFAVISRSQLKTLMKEVKLDGIGALAPGNIPKLGRLKGIDLIIGATLNFSANEIRLNVLGIQLESGSILAGTKGIIPRTPSTNLLLGSGYSSQDLVIAEEPSDEIEKVPIAEISAGGLKITSKGCTSIGNMVHCDFDLLNVGEDTDLSIYTPRSTIHLPNQLTVVPRKIVLGKQAGDRRITTTVRARQNIELSVIFLSPSPLNQDIPKVELVCYSNTYGTFNITFLQTPIK